MDRARGTYSVQSVLKAFDLLEALAAEGAHVTVPLLAQKLDLSRNKVFRLLATLEDSGFIERDGDGVYRLGLHAFEMAQHILKSASLIRLAHPVMEALARKHDEAVYITVMNNDEVLFLDMVDSFQQIKAMDMVGQRFPFFTNAAGKAIKAMSSPDIIRHMGRRRVGKAGAPDLKQLEKELHEIRKNGVAIDFGGVGDGICAVAVAIRDYAGKVVGALTMLAPSFRMLHERLEQEIVPSMREGAEVISMKFGYARMPAS
ncbi:IclR family transcriptional regulator [Oryzomonas japonica]|uniref:IclR family transcriptional regulator n=1 Tax=Oryzomonas japonica TaxID=2603858 RepID=A0A7J4ZP43_9BACT|nr:IclR family transcriptional regulator [Oryzomonas japonica]KAB0664674.1 IclR family transcriptional regulator [Oryzomonas japonica]